MIQEASIARAKAKSHNSHHSNYKRGLGGGFCFMGHAFDAGAAVVAIGLLGELAVSIALEDHGCSGIDTSIIAGGDGGVDLRCGHHTIDVKTRYARNDGKGWRINKSHNGYQKRLQSTTFVFCTLARYGVIIGGWAPRDRVQRLGVEEPSRYNQKVINTVISDRYVLPFSSLLSCFGTISP